MAKYVFSYRVPSDYAPHAGTAAEWQAWFGGLGPALVDFGHAVTDYASLGEAGGSDSRMVGYSVVSAEDMDSALVLAKDCPALRVGGGVEVGPVMEAAGSCGAMTASTAPPQGSFLATRRGQVTLALLCAVTFLDVMDGSIVNVALPTIRTHLGFSVQNLQWVVSGYLITYGGFLLLGGRAGDLLGRRGGC